ncbi:hypothetical protein AB0M43_37225 [Longispora sp. NPDC051575]|uniref:hypothetical protein n=1 Tax=Longispora sp. NPDC051575 TaxID=3154943 RepID=UPI00342B8873
MSRAVTAARDNAAELTAAPGPAAGAMTEDKVTSVRCEPWLSIARATARRLVVSGVHHRSACPGLDPTSVWPSPVPG